MAHGLTYTYLMLGGTSVMGRVAGRGSPLEQCIHQKQRLNRPFKSKVNGRVSQYLCLDKWLKDYNKGWVSVYVHKTHTHRKLLRVLVIISVQIVFAIRDF